MLSCKRQHYGKGKELHVWSGNANRFILCSVWTRCFLMEHEIPMCASVCIFNIQIGDVFSL